MEHYALAAQVYGVALIFARLGAFFMLMPGVNESGVPPMVRLSFTFLFSLMMFPVLAKGLPAEPTLLSDMAFQITMEIMVGLFLGLFLSLFMASLSVAGEIMSLQSTLSFSQTVNPLEAQPTTSVTSFLTMVGLALLFTTDLHEVFIAGIVRSYHLFPAGRGAPLADMSAAVLKTFSDTFALGLQLSAPVMVFSLVYHISLGFIARAMPQFQVFFISTPLTVLLGLAIIALGLGGTGIVWTSHFRDFVGQWI